MVQAINDPGRALHGDATVPHTVVLGQATGAPQRELTQRYIRLTDMSQLHSIAPTYIIFSGKMLISGLTFLFCDGRSAHIGYVRTNQVSSDSCTIPPKFLWVVSSQLGFESLTVGAYPNEILESIKPTNAQRLAVTRWTVQNLKGICLGMDAMRIVTICMDTNKQPGLENILWTPPYPLLLPVIHETDLAALQQLQGESYNPATGYLIESSYGCLTSVKLYSSLGFRAGITGIGFLYDSVSEHLWGTSDETASLAFFLSRDEHIISIRIYTVKSLVCHMQFTTNFHRISNIFPELPQVPNQIFECIEYRYLHSGHVKGVSGCFTGPSKRLHCFGVFPMKMAVSTKMSWTPPKITLPTHVDKTLPEMPLGDIGFHGSYQSRISLRQQYKSIQASISQTRSRYRRVGQVTGLLFYSSHDPDHPDLLGQWTGAGEVYNLHKDERIVDIDVTKIQPIQKQRNRPGLSQVESILIVTDRMRIQWSSSGCERDVLDHSHCQSNIKEVSWEFNTMFDRLSYV